MLGLSVDLASDVVITEFVAVVEIVEGKCRGPCSYTPHSFVFELGFSRMEVRAKPEKCKVLFMPAISLDSHSIP